VVKVGIPGTRQHGALSQRDVHSLSHPGLYIEGGLGLKGIRIGGGTRDAGGAQAITGVGFTPSLVIIIAYATGGVNQILSIGMDDATTRWVVALQGQSVNVTSATAYSVYCYIDTSNYLRGSITSMDADGFTITWLLTGACSVTFKYIAIQ